MLIRKFNHPTLIAPGLIIIRDPKLSLYWFWCYIHIIFALPKIIATSRVLLQTLLWDHFNHSWPVGLVQFTNAPGHPASLKPHLSSNIAFPSKRTIGFIALASMTGKNQNMFFSLWSRFHSHEPFVLAKLSLLHAPFLGYLRSSRLLERRTTQHC